MAYVSPMPTKITRKIALQYRPARLLEGLILCRFHGLASWIFSMPIDRTFSRNRPGPFHQMLFPWCKGLPLGYRDVFVRLISLDLAYVATYLERRYDFDVGSSRV